MSRKPKSFAVLALSLALLAGATGAWAHHSAVMYDNAHPRTLEGTVKAFNWSNPHVTLEFLATDKGGKPPALWTVEMSSPGVLTRAGWTKRSFNPGERVEIELYPLKGGGPGGLLVKGVNLTSGEHLTWSFKPGERPGIQ